MLLKHGSDYHQLVLGHMKPGDTVKLHALHRASPLLRRQLRDLGITEGSVLLGNPNTGKTSLFNMLTRSCETVGNRSGVKVEKKVGVLRGRGGRIVDLPGLYSLLPLTEDEGVAARFLMEESPASLLNIVDASQLERNLYLTIQLPECGRPMPIGLNMIDVARSRNITVDAASLQQELGVPVVSIVARKGTGCADVLQALGGLAQSEKSSFRIDYGPVIESSVTRMPERLSQAAHNRHSE